RRRAARPRRPHVRHLGRRRRQPAQEGPPHRRLNATAPPTRRPRASRRRRRNRYEVLAESRPCAVFTICSGSSSFEYEESASNSSSAPLSLSSSSPRSTVLPASALHAWCTSVLHAID